MSTYEIVASILGVLGFALSLFLLIKAICDNHPRVSVVSAESFSYAMEGYWLYILVCTVNNRSARTLPLLGLRLSTTNPAQSWCSVSAYERECILRECTNARKGNEINSLLSAYSTPPSNLPAHCVSQIALVYRSNYAPPALAAHLHALESKEDEGNGSTVSPSVPDARQPAASTIRPTQYRVHGSLTLVDRAVPVSFCVDALK